MTYIGVCVNYIFFYKALQAQGYDRDTLPWKGFFQPYASWIGLVWMVLIELFYGYAVFLKGHWDIGSFFSSYTMALLACVTFSGWKIFKRTKAIPPHEADLVWARPSVDHHEALFAEMESSLWQTVREILSLDKLGKAFKSEA